MPTQPEFLVHTDALPDLVRVRYFGRVTAQGVEACCAEVVRLLPSARKGFTVLTDLTELESMDLDCVPHLARMMDASREHGVGTVVRIIPDRDKDIGFNILSIIHYRKGVQIITCESLAEAEQVLNSSKK